MRVTSIAAAALGLVALLTVWTLASSIWSADVPASVDEGERTLVYLSALLLLVLVADRTSGAQLVRAVFGAVSVVVFYALGRLLLPTGSQRPLPFEGFSLARPIGYANAIGVLAAIGIILALELMRDAHRFIRAGAAASLCGFAPALYLTGSRASWLAVAVGTAALLALDPARLELTARIAVVTAAPVAAVLLARQAHVTSGEPGWRGRDLLLELVALGGAAAASTLLADRLAADTRRRRLAPAALALAAGAAVVVGAERVSVSLGDRGIYWAAAWHEYTAHPWLGSGAGTFGHAYAVYAAAHQPAVFAAREAHNVYLETLAELGPAGLLLLTGLFALPLVAAVRSRQRAYAPAAAALLATFLVHAFFDWDWELPAITLVGLAGTGAALSAAASDGTALVVQRRGRTLLLALVGCLGALAVGAFAIRR